MRGGVCQAGGGGCWDVGDGRMGRWMRVVDVVWWTGGKGGWGVVEEVGWALGGRVCWLGRSVDVGMDGRDDGRVVVSSKSK